MTSKNVSMKAVFGLVVYLLLGAQSGEGVDSIESANVRPITDAETIFAIYVEDWRFNSDGTKLIVAIWDDGHVVWSENQTYGGGPYRYANVDQSELLALIADIDDDGYFRDTTLERANFGPDSRFATILVSSKDHKLKMQSFHELLDHSSLEKTAMSDKSRTFFETKLGKLSQSNADELYYRLAWAELRLRFWKVIPEDSKSEHGQVVVRDGKLFWQRDLE